MALGRQGTGDDGGASGIRDVGGGVEIAWWVFGWRGCVGRVLVGAWEGWLRGRDWMASMWQWCWTCVVERDVPLLEDMWESRAAATAFVVEQSCLKCY